MFYQNLQVLGYSFGDYQRHPSHCLTATTLYQACLFEILGVPFVFIFLFPDFSHHWSKVPQAENLLPQKTC